jgi:hypothetical protein
VCTITQKNNNTQHFPVVVVLLGKVWTHRSLKEGSIVATKVFDRDNANLLALSGLNNLNHHHAANCHRKI